jgi:hypothetical protein
VNVQQWNKNVTPTSAETSAATLSSPSPPAKIAADATKTTMITTKATVFPLFDNVSYRPAYLNDLHHPWNDPDFFSYLPPKTLSVGHKIEFYAPEGVAGNPYWLRQATIIGLSPNNPRSPLVLDPFHFLPWDHRITRVPSKPDTPQNSLGDDDETIRRSINQFVFTGELGVQNRAAGLIWAGEQARTVRNEIEKEADRWWESLSSSPSQRGNRH